MSTEEKPYFEGRDVVSMRDFTREEIDAILDVADDVKRAIHDQSAASEFKRKYGKDINDLFQGIKIATLFRENSTRTNFSFRAAVGGLEGFVDGFPSDDYTSFKKGETWGHAVAMFAGWGYDALVCRTKTEGIPRWTQEYLERVHASMISKHKRMGQGYSYRRPMILNGGDGKNQHPTQCFLDLFTMRESARMEGKELDGLEVALLNDLAHGRTNASLMSVAHLFDWKLHFAYPDRFGPQQHRLDDLIRNGVSIEDHGSDFKSAMTAALIAYHSRPQKERVGVGEDLISIKELGRINRVMYDALGINAPYLMHPLPIDAETFEEIAFDIDSHEMNWTKVQSSNGLYVRVALMALGLGLIDSQADLQGKDLIEIVGLSSKMLDLSIGDKDLTHARSGVIPKDGLVIDHIPPGMSRRLDGILGLEQSRLPIISSRYLEVDGGKQPEKDMVKIHCGYDLSEPQLEAIALLAPDATVSVVRGGRVVRKYRPLIGNHVADRVTCGNGACVTNVGIEHVIPKHHLESSESGPVLSCEYCEHTDTVPSVYAANRFRYLSPDHALIGIRRP
mgnify:CR=1 FL=1